MTPMFSKALLVTTTASLVLCLTTTADAVPILSVVPAFQQVDNPGDPLVDVDLVISNLGLGEELGSFDIDITYNSAVVSFISYALGPGLGDPTNPTEFLDLSLGDLGGVVDLAGLSLLDEATLQGLQGTGFTLATLDFDAIGFGLSHFIVQQNGNFVFGDGAGNALTVSVQNGAIQVGTNPIPEPATLWLLGLGGAALARSRFCSVEKGRWK